MYIIIESEVFMSVKDIFQSFTDKFHATANVAIIFGEPIKEGKKTVVPIAKAQYAFGAGGASLTLNTDNNDNSDAGGGGGMVKTTPIGALEITEEKTRFIPIFSLGDLVMILSVIFTFVYRLRKIKERSKKKNESI